MKLKNVLTALILLASQHSFAQVDPHFSQYYTYPSWLNPALTGAFQGNVRVSGIYRNQWGSITSPFSTPGVSVDFATPKSMNFGVSLLNQTAGDGGYNYTTGYGSAAFTGLRWGQNGTQHLVLGLQGGFVSRKFNPLKLKFGDQWNPITGYNPGAATSDILSRTQSSVFDFGAGALFYDGRVNRKSNFYAGFSANHLTRPTDPFSAGQKEKLPVRMALHGGVRLQLSPTSTITPNFLYLRQGNASETMLGAYGQFKGGQDFDLMLGANIRFNDAIAPYIGFLHKNFMLGASYDVNISDLGRRVNGTSSFEITFTYIGKKKDKFESENFVCPRL
jgi:type IX secretion system PorP/SprF family membrane protein